MTTVADYGMIVLFTVYAITFFVMAAVTWRRLEQTARIGIAAPMAMLVVFAVLHGLSDVVDVLLRLPGTESSPVGALAAIRLVLLVASFVFLFVYGLLALIDDESIRRTVFLLGMIALIAAMGALTALFAEDVPAGSIGAVERTIRLFVALPGGLLASAALIRAGEICGRLGAGQCQMGARIAAAGMAAYAIFAGAFATGYPVALRLAGIPIQAYRMTAAMVVTVGLAWMLERMALSGKRDHE